MHKVSGFLPLLVVLVISAGCSSTKNFVNFREGDFYTAGQNIENDQPLTIKPGDLLSVVLSSTELESVAIFNDYQPGGYEVSEKGNISFALIGDVKVEGKTLDEAKEILTEATRKYFVDPPVVSVKLTNFKLTVNGAVSSPQVLVVPNGKINIVEAITRTGDFSPYARRDSVMVIREVDNTRTVGFVNFYNKDMFNSPFFYLQQNDIVYVKPNKNYVATVRTRPEKLSTYFSLGISVLLLVINISRL